MSSNSANSVAILGINGRVGQHAAQAFVAAGWRVTGFGRTDRVHIEGVDFFAGTADKASDVRAACAGSDVVVHGLNLPYDKWDNGRYEAQMTTVLDALKGSGKTMIFAGNIYNYGEDQHLITPKTPQRPARDKGEIRVRLENMLAASSQSGDLQVLIVRAPDFFGPGMTGTYFDLVMLAKAGNGVLQYPGEPNLKHSWAYLPDLGAAYEKVASVRHELRRFENLHFRGFVATGDEMIAQIRTALPNRVKVRRFNWTMLRPLGLFVPMVREIVKMSYLWREPHELFDEKLDAILGPEFGTPFEVAVARTVRSCLPAVNGEKRAA